MKNNKTKADYLGHRKRLKERFSEKNLKDFAGYEILEFALTFAIPRKDTKPLAKELIKKFGSLKQVLDASCEELQTVKGISEHTSLFISFLKQTALLYRYLEIKEGESLSSPQEVVNYLISALSGEKIEKFCAVMLNSGNKVIECVELEKGTVNKSVVMPRKIAEAALKYKSASVIIAHNHPGGTLKPSQNDIEATKAVYSALKSIDVALLDHIIISNGNYFSFKEYNLI
ncbi:MAG: DNA repair protein RadC [Endomicrobia bacterium]|nr:DNA repair protein RadC [Endomicrobiia bacterium]MCL2506625.1 DNA repair protein RadC [Endomicrobiia bacterium]